MSTQDNHAKQQAAAQYASIAALVHAYNLDWVKYESLVYLLADHEFDMREANDPKPFEIAYPDEAELLAEFEQAKTDTECDSQESVQDRIQETPLSVEIRSGWASVGDEMTAEEFRIVLCTGGPAVQIRGELDFNGLPNRAWIEYQDWGTPWVQYFDADQDTLIEFCNHFYFGE